MQKVFFQSVIMPGYQSGETAFDPVFIRAVDGVPGFADAFQQNVLTPVAEDAQDQSRCGVLQIHGFADRVDTPGLSREQIRQQEFTASDARAVSTADGLFAMVNDAAGGGLGSSWSDVPNIAIAAVGRGAPTLVENSANLSEIQRQRNRRIGIVYFRFVPQVGGGVLGAVELPDVGTRIV